MTGLEQRCQRIFIQFHTDFYMIHKWQWVKLVKCKIEDRKNCKHETKSKEKTLIFSEGSKYWKVLTRMWNVCVHTSAQLPGAYTFLWMMENCSESMWKNEFAFYMLWNLDFIIVTGLKEIYLWEIFLRRREYLKYFLVKNKLVLKKYLKAWEYKDRNVFKKNL